MQPMLEGSSMARGPMGRQAQNEFATEDEEEFYMQHENARRSRVCASALVVTTLVVAMCASIGIYTGAFSQSSGPAATAPRPWVATAPVGPLPPQASPRSLSAAEYFQTPKFSHAMADQLKMLHNEYNGESGEVYSCPEEQAQAHTAATHQISSFIGNLSMSHPQVALLLHETQLDDAQQRVAMKVLEHFSDKKTMKLGAEVLSMGGLTGGKKAIKKRLQAKLGPRLEELRRIRNEIFPKDFDVEKKNTALRGSEDDEDDEDDANFQIVSQANRQQDMQSINDLKNHLNPIKASDEVARRLMGVWPIVNIIGSIVVTVICTIIGAVVPGITGGLIVGGLKALITIVTCVEWHMAPLNWIGCVINLVNSVLMVLFMFVPNNIFR